MKKSSISKKSTIKEAIEKNPDAEKILFEEGMHCAGCPMAMYETLEDGANTHGIDAEKLTKKLNKKK